jgi:PAS domain S-box-containing protein
MKLQTFILDHLDPLVDDWAAYARTLPGCENLGLEALRDHAAAMLRVIAADIGSTQTAAEQLAKSHGLAPRQQPGDSRAEEHGTDRFTQGFGLNELVGEFRALRASVVRQWTARRGPATVDMLEQLVRFNEGIDQAIAESVARFVTEVRQRDEETLRRREAEARHLHEQERRTHRAEDRLHTALLAARMAHWEWDTGADRLSTSPTLHDLFGLRPGQRLDRSAEGLALLHPDDRAAHATLVADAVRHRAGWHTRFRVVRPVDGALVWFEERATPIAEPGGPVVVTGLVWDITGRKAAEEALKRNERTFVELIEHAPFGVYVVDSQLRLRHLNHGSREGPFRNVRPLLGRPLAEALQTIWPPPVAAAVLAAFQHTLATGEPYRSPRFVNRRADVDSVESYEWELHRSVLPDGQDGVVCYYFDSTQLRAAEAALREADHRKDRFLATLAHELRNPLAPIRQAAAIARAGNVPADRVRWSVEVIDRQAAKMALLLDDLLDVSRITHGRLELHRRTVDVAEVVRSAVETVTPLLDASRHVLRTDLPAAPLPLHADPLRLSQVVANLLTNAARYSPAGSPIGLGVRRDGTVAEIVVSDQGIGIAPDQLGAVFEMFWQGSDPVVRHEGGLGVGLALARGLVELHGGTLRAHSAGPGRGAQFVLRVPCIARVGAPAAGDERTAPAAAAPARERVLVVDDNVDAADSLAALLRLQGHEVRTAYGGAEGLAAAEGFHPHLVLLDLGMPHVDGYEVARRLRAMPGGAAYTLVAVSGWGQAADRRRSADAGFDHHLTKPLAEAQLAPALAEAQRRHRLA